MQFKIMGYDKDYNDLDAQWIEAGKDHKLAIKTYLKSHPKAIQAHLYGIEGYGFPDDQPPRTGG